ncbi:MAG: DUF192 domain-containing protein [Candidatus Micrarchaeota archaeon]
MDKITLTQQSFKALASDTRIQLLKQLDTRRYTASELSKLTSLSVQAVTEHLQKMDEAGLIEKQSDGRKWVYYALTKDGKAVVHPEQSNFMVLLTIFILAIASASFLLYSGLTPSSPVQTKFNGQMALATAPAALGVDGSTASAGEPPVIVSFESGDYATVTMPDGFAIQAEMAVTPEQRSAGLSNRDSLCASCGMLFIFEDERQREFWMKDTNIPLDIIFLDSQGNIVGLKPNAQPCLQDPCPIYRSVEPSSLVLEINAGQAQAHGLFFE